MRFLSTSTRRSAIGIGLIISLTSIFPRISAAAWTEAGHEILNLDEIQSRLAPGVRSDLPGDLPVLMPKGESADAPRALSIALIQSGFALQGETGAWDIRRVGIPQADLAARRLQPIAPVTPRIGNDDAIASGGFIVQGRILEPPYLVEGDAESVFINSVKVYPSGGSRITPPKIDTEQSAAYEREDRAWKHYEQSRGSASEAEARERFRRETLTWPEVRKAEWINDTVLGLTGADGRVSYYSFERTRSKTNEDPPGAAQDLLENVAENLRRDLAAGRTVVAGSTYFFTVDEESPEALRRRLLEIKNGAESDLLKLARIQAHLGRREAAADLLYTR